MGTRGCKIAELCIDIDEGQAIVQKNNEIDFQDCTPIHVKKLEFVVQEAKAFIRYRSKRLKI